MDSQNIYWTFSAAAQSIAAFIGFMTAGFFFVYEKISFQGDDDETLIEINKALQKKYYNILKTLLYLTGGTIIFCLLISFLNGHDFGFKIVLIILCSLLIIVTISWAIYFVIQIIDPAKIKKTAIRISSKEKSLSDIKKESNKSVSEFLMKFIELERRIRKLAEQNDMPMSFRNVPLNKYLDFLEAVQKISKEQSIKISELMRTRNYAVHGQSTYIDNRLIQSLDELLEEIE